MHGETVKFNSIECFVPFPAEEIRKVGGWDAGNFQQKSRARIPEKNTPITLDVVWPLLQHTQQAAVNIVKPGLQ